MVLAIAEFYHWLGGMGMPGPLLVAAGIVLAIASNRGKHINLPWRSPHAPTLGVSKPNATRPSSPATKPIAAPMHEAGEATLIEATPVQPVRPSVELPQFGKPAPPPNPISFTVRKPE